MQQNSWQTFRASGDVQASGTQSKFSHLPLPQGGELDERVPEQAGPSVAAAIGQSNGSGTVRRASSVPQVGAAFGRVEISASSTTGDEAIGGAAASIPTTAKGNKLRTKRLNRLQLATR